jgi:hypothetical protein
MNVEIGTEAGLFPEKEYINGIAVAVWIRIWVWIWTHSTAFMKPENQQGAKNTNAFLVSKDVTHGHEFPNHTCITWNPSLWRP